MSSSIEKVIQEKYRQVAVSGLSSSQQGVRSVAEAFGYSAEELNSIPADANMGLSCHQGALDYPTHAPSENDKPLR